MERKLWIKEFEPTLFWNFQKTKCALSVKVYVIFEFEERRKKFTLQAPWVAQVNIRMDPIKGK